MPKFLKPFILAQIFARFVIVSKLQCLSTVLWIVVHVHSYHNCRLRRDNATVVSGEIAHSSIAGIRSPADRSAKFRPWKRIQSSLGENDKRSGEYLHMTVGHV